MYLLGGVSVAVCLSLLRGVNALTAGMWSEVCCPKLTFKYSTFK